MKKQQTIKGIATDRSDAESMPSVDYRIAAGLAALKNEAQKEEVEKYIWEKVISNAVTQ